MITGLDSLPAFTRSVLVGGVFDPLHGGHIAYLRAARAYDHRVVCAVSPDAGDKHPTLLPLVDRLAVIDALRMVSVVVPNETGIVPILEKLQPWSYIKGEDWRGRLPAEEIEACQRLGVNIIYTPTKSASSTELLQSYTQEVSKRGVEWFESFVRLQQPASKPWEPVTDYSLEGRRQAEGQHPDLILEVFRPLTIMDAGCGHGYLVQFLKERGANVVGYDLEDGFNLADPYLVGCKSELAICREVLEHLTVRQIRQAVRNLVRLSSRFIYVTTRFASWPTHPYDVQDHDDLDPTHISLLPKELLRSWFVAEGCKSRPDLEARMDWQQKGRCLVFEV